MLSHFAAFFSFTTTNISDTNDLNVKAPPIFPKPTPTQPPAPHLPTICPSQPPTQPPTQLPSPPRPPLTMPVIPQDGFVL